MTRDPLLTLSDTQSDAVRRGADMLHPSLREKFLASVQDRLLSLGRGPTDAEVTAAVSEVQWAITERARDDDFP